MTTQDIILIAMALVLLVVVVFEWRARLAEEGPVIIKPTIPPPVPPIKVFRRKYKYIVVEHHDERSLNDTAEKYQNEGYVMDRDKSTDRLLVFVKSEEVTSEAPKDKNERPGEVFLCILHNDDRSFNMVTGCFYDEEVACRYAFKSKNTTVQCIKVE